MLSADGMQGMKRFDARKSIETALREAGLYRGKVDHEMQLPICRLVFAAVSYKNTGPWLVPRMHSIAW